jgi:hypothetical protein
MPSPIAGDPKPSLRDAGIALCATVPDIALAGAMSLRRHGAGEEGAWKPQCWTVH